MTIDTREVVDMIEALRKKAQTDWVKKALDIFCDELILQINEYEERELNEMAEKETEGI